MRSSTYTIVICQNLFSEKKLKLLFDVTLILNLYLRIQKTKFSTCFHKTFNSATNDLELGQSNEKFIEKYSEKHSCKNTLTHNCLTHNCSFRKAQQQIKRTEKYREIQSEERWLIRRMDRAANKKNKKLPQKAFVRNYIPVRKYFLTTTVPSAAKEQ